MQIVRHIDEIRWKEFVDRNPDGNIFHTPEMFEVFARTKGHAPDLLAATEEDGTILALLPVVKLTLIDGPLRLLTTRAVAYGSVLCAPTPQGRAALDLLLQTYNRDQRRGVLFTEFRNLSDLSSLQPKFARSGFIYEDHLNFLIDLTQPQDTLWRCLNKSARQRIRSAEKKGITVEEAAGHPHLDIAYHFLQQVYERVQVPLADKSLFDNAFELLASKGMLKVFLAKTGDEYAAAALWLVYHGRMLSWYLGSDRSKSAYSPGEVLVWQAMQWGTQNGLQIFDLGGGGRPADKYGPREFKSKFGGAQVNFGRQTRVHAPLRLKLSAVGYELYRRVAA